MQQKTLAARFSESVWSFLHLKEKPRLAYAHIMRLFDFSSDRYVTEQARESEMRIFLNIHSPRSAMTDTGPARVFYADPDDCFAMPDRAGSSSIYPVTVQKTPRSAAILAHEGGTEFGRTLIVLIRDRLQNPGKPYDNTVRFALYGTRRDDGYIKLHKMLVPEIDGANRMTGLRRVDLSDYDDIARGLSYARLCVAQLMGGEGFNPRDNMKTVMAGPAEAGLIPWKKAPVPSP